MGIRNTKDMARRMVCKISEFKIYLGLRMKARSTEAGSNAPFIWI